MIVIGRPFRTGWIPLEKYRRIIAAGVVYDKERKTYKIPEDLDLVRVFNEVYPALAGNPIGIVCKNCQQVYEIFEYEEHLEEETRSEREWLPLVRSEETNWVNWRRCYNCGSSMKGEVVGWFTVKFWCKVCERSVQREIPGKYEDFIRDEALRLLLEEEEMKTSAYLSAIKLAGGVTLPQSSNTL